MHSLTHGLLRLGETQPYCLVTNMWSDTRALEEKLLYRVQLGQTECAEDAT